MPDMNGLELSRALREAVPDLKIVYISGYPDQVVSQGGALDTSSALVRKPFTLEQLFNAIADACGEN